MKRMLVTIALGLFWQTNLTLAQNWVTSFAVPNDAIVGGQEAGGAQLYICHGGLKEGFGIQPGKFRPGFAGCNFGYAGKEYSTSDFQFLVSSWQNASGGNVPSNAVVGGCEAPGPAQFCGPTLYYCRASIAGYTGLQPGKTRPGLLGCNIPFNGQNLIEVSYQVLVALNPAMPLTSVGASNGAVPLGALRGGTDLGGQPLYLCSAVYSGGLHPGKVRPGLGACNISYGSREIAVQTYAVQVPTWLPFPPAFRIVPKFDFQTGREADRTPLFTCRAYFGRGTHPGKYIPSAGSCNFGYGGLEHSQTSGFDVLTDWSQITP
jgi:hypothetical protein